MEGPEVADVRAGVRPALCSLGRARCGVSSVGAEGGGDLPPVSSVIVAVVTLFGGCGVAMEAGCRNVYDAGGCACIKAVVVMVGSLPGGLEGGG